MKSTPSRFRFITLAIVFIWFFVGGIFHFALPQFFLEIIPPQLPFRIEAVYISGFFEIVGALGLLRTGLRRYAGYGLIALTVVVTPANVYMWLHAELFPAIPPILLGARLALQIVLLAGIWWSATQERCPD